MKTPPRFYMQQLHDLLATGHIESFQRMSDEDKTIFLDAFANQETVTEEEGNTLATLALEIFFKTGAFGTPIENFLAAQAAAFAAESAAALHPRDLLDALAGKHGKDRADEAADMLQDTVFLDTASVLGYYPTYDEIADSLAEPETIVARYDVEALAASTPLYADELDADLQEPIWVLRCSPSPEEHEAATRSLDDLGWAFAMYHGHKRARWCLLPLRCGVGVPMLLI